MASIHTAVVLGLFAACLEFTVGLFAAWSNFVNIIFCNFTPFVGYFNNIYISLLILRVIVECALCAYQPACETLSLCDIS